MKRLLILTTLGLFLAAHCAVAVMTVSVLSVHPIVVASELTPKQKRPLGQPCTGR